MEEEPEPILEGLRQSRQELENAMHGTRSPCQDFEDAVNESYPVSSSSRADLLQRLSAVDAVLAPF